MPNGFAGTAHSMYVLDGFAFQIANVSNTLQAKMPPFVLLIYSLVGIVQGIVVPETDADSSVRS